MEGTGRPWWEKPKTSIVMVPSWRCNLACGYCDYSTQKRGDGVKLKMFGKEYDVGPEMPWPAWLMCLERFMPYHLDFTGGEPLMYEGLDALVAHLPYGSTWAMTSNTLDPRGVIPRLHPYNCVAWTSSYHYVQEGRYFKNLNDLKRAGFGVRVTLVATAENVAQVRHAIKDLRRQEIMVNIHPLLKEGFDWADHRQVYESFEALDDRPLINFIKETPTCFGRIERNRPIKCWAGVNYFVIWPDGTLFRCYTEMIEGRKLGDIRSYVPPATGYECVQKCAVPCDIDRPMKDIQ